MNISRKELNAVINSIEGKAVRQRRTHSIWRYISPQEPRDCPFCNETFRTDILLQHLRNKHFDGQKELFLEVNTGIEDICHSYKPTPHKDPITRDIILLPRIRVSPHTDQEKKSMISWTCSCKDCQHIKNCSKLAKMNRRHFS